MTGERKQGSRGDGGGYRAGQDNIEILGLDIHGAVFLISGATVVAFVLGVLLFQEEASSLFGSLRPWLTTNLDWVFMASANAVLLFSLFLIASPLGGVRIGGRDARPRYSRPSWFAMLLSAGMGIGLMFFGVLEPVHHFQNPRLGTDPGDTEAARSAAMAATIFHWGLHPWAIYGVMGLALAFFCYNRGLPLTIRSAFHPLLGDRVWGWSGHAIDTLAVFATLFGLATSLGLGAGQITGGFHFLLGTAKTDLFRVVLIVLITFVATISVVTGIDVGIKRLSQGNMALAGLLMLFVIAVGPTWEILRGVFTGLGAYALKVVPLSSWVGRQDTGFLHGWTTFYWAWWISWAPFVGLFIARISRGRTVREFLVFVLVLPTLLSALWMNVFGGTAVHQLVAEGYTGVAETVAAWTPELSLFKMLEPLPATGLLSFVSIFLVVVFFITSSDSGSLVVDTITAGGKLESPPAQRVFWCAVEGLIAIALLLGGGLQSLQAAAIAAGFPIALLLFGLILGLWTALRREPR